MGTALTVPEVVELLAPGGKYETGRLALRKEHGVVLENAKKVTAIETAEQAEEATNFGRLLQTATKESEAFFKVHKALLDALKKPVLEAEKTDVGGYENEKQRLGGLLTAYLKKCELARQEEERKARIEAERQAQEEALLRAIEHESIGDIDSAEAVLQEPLYVAPVVTATKVVKTAGSVSKMNYSAKVLNLMALVKAVAEGKVPLVALEVNQGYLNNQAKMLKEAYSIPGTQLVAEPATHFRS